LKTVDVVTAGTFLVASPLLRDPNFVRTVVLLCDHDDEGSWGLVVNRRTHLTFGELLDDLPVATGSDGPVYWGGPCETSRLQLLHDLRRDLDNEIEICPGIHLGVDPVSLQEILADSLLPGESQHAYVGHAGWGPGQLAAELASGAWITCTADPTIVFGAEPERVWDDVLRSLGPKYARLTHVPIDPRLN
jgi:putative transcriptional regulator